LCGGASEIVEMSSDDDDGGGSEDVDEDAGVERDNDVEMPWNIQTMVCLV